MTDSTTDSAAHVATARTAIPKYKDLNGWQILTDYKEPDILSDYTLLNTTQSGNTLRPDWNEILRLCKDMGYVIRVHEKARVELFRFSLKTGYYEPTYLEDMVRDLIRILRQYYPAYTVPVTFSALVENNVIHSLPDVDGDLGSSMEFSDIFPFYTNSELIPFRNGIYSVQNNALLPRTSYLFIQHPLDVDFDPAALNNPISEKFMEMMCGNECLFELMFEQIGYALFARTFIMPTITIFYGSGANGKSIVLDLVRKIVGSQNISELSMYDMTNAFSLASSEGKLLNLSTDSSAGPGESLIATANIAEFMKKATSGEAFAFNPKHGKLHSGYGPRKFMFATNVMLKFGGIDDGLARRIYAIPFNARFEDDYTMKVKLTSEETKGWFAMQALVSFCAMIHRAMGAEMFSSPELRGTYLVCSVADEMKVEQLTSQDSVLDWLSDELELDIIDVEEVKQALAGQETLYESYCYFCHATNRQSKSRKSFHSTLKTRFGIEFRRTTIGGLKRWVTDA